MSKSRLFATAAARFFSTGPAKKLAEGLGTTAASGVADFAHHKLASNRNLLNGTRNFSSYTGVMSNQGGQVNYSDDTKPGSVVDVLMAERVSEVSLRSHISNIQHACALVRELLAYNKHRDLKGLHDFLGECSRLAEHMTHESFREEAMRDPKFKEYFYPDNVQSMFGKLETAKKKNIISDADHEEVVGAINYVMDAFPGIGLGNFARQALGGQGSDVSRG